MDDSSIDSMVNQQPLADLVEFADEESLAGERPGANAAAPAAFSDGDDLPMIVWLRGDEAYAGDFSIDAEGTMQALGIKRSRLTQISGKELRVGRIRIDRYTRPMYRQQDIDAYRRWTRATATHLRSSSIISEAANKLEDHAFQLSETLLDAVRTHTNQVDSSLNNLMADIAARQQASQQVSQNLLDSLKLEVIENHNKQQEQNRTRFDDVSLIVESLSNRIAVLAVSAGEAQERDTALGQEIAALQATAQTLSEGLTQVKTWQETQTAFNRDLGKALAMILQFQREHHKKQEEFSLLLQKMPAAEAAKPANRRLRRPMRRFRQVLATPPQQAALAKTADHGE